MGNFLRLCFVYIIIKSYICLMIDKAAYELLLGLVEAKMKTGRMSTVFSKYDYAHDGFIIWKETGDWEYAKKKTLNLLYTEYQSKLWHFPIHMPIEKEKAYVELFVCTKCNEIWPETAYRLRAKTCLWCERKASRVESHTEEQRKRHLSTSSIWQKRQKDDLTDYYIKKLLKDWDATPAAIHKKRQEMLAKRKKGVYSGKRRKS